ncbi:hypothetical protein BaRGS_00039182, partial [Batillaria attramentaria]
MKNESVENTHVQPSWEYSTVAKQFKFVGYDTVETRSGNFLPVSGTASHTPCASR